MIYDFGCMAGGASLVRFAGALTGVGAVVLVTIGLIALGSLSMRDRHLSINNLFCGWGIVASGLTLAAVFWPQALPDTAVILALAMGVAVIRYGACPSLRSPFWLLVLFPGLIILTTLNLSGIAGWDDFSHWVPNALYLYHFNDVPHLSLPSPHSAWPSYPYALPMVTYLASHLAGGFLMQGGAMFNFLCLLAFAALLAQANEPQDMKASLNFRSLGLAAFALLLVTLANPSFNASFTMTNEGDTSTMVLTGVLALLFWRAGEDLRHGIHDTLKDLAFQIALTSLAYVLIKQVNVDLLALLAFAFLVNATKNKTWKESLRWLPLMICPALLMHFVWQHYTTLEMANAGFGVRPLAAWRFDLVGDITKAMLQEMIRKNGLFGLTLLTSIVGLVSLFKPTTPARHFALLGGIVGSGYIVFLFLAYVGSTFGEDEIKRAAAFYRYTTHIGLLGLIFLWLEAPVLWHKMRGHILSRSFLIPPPLHRAGILFLVGALPLALLLHSPWLIPQANAKICEFRSIGQRVARAVPDQTHMAVLSDGDILFDFIVNFETAIQEMQTGRVAKVTDHGNVANTPSLSAFEQRFENQTDVNALLIQSQKLPQFSVAGSEGYVPPLLLLRHDQDWHLRQY